MHVKETYRHILCSIWMDLLAPKWHMEVLDMSLFCKLVAHSVDNSNEIQKLHNMLTLTIGQNNEFYPCNTLMVYNVIW